MTQTGRLFQIMILCGWFLSILASVAEAACTVSTTSINFGTYNFLSSVPLTGTGTITLSCTQQTDVRVGIGASQYNGSFYPRIMAHSMVADTLEYNLYTSNAYVTVWGDGTQGTVTAFFSKVKKSNTPPIRIYGKISTLQNSTPGIYTEQLVVTLTF